MANTKRSRARTPEQQENILINLAYKLAEKRLREGTATSQMICQLLMQGTEKKRLENEKLKAEVEVANAKIKQLEQSVSSESIYKEAIKAFQQYSGQEIIDPDDDEWEED